MGARESSRRRALNKEAGVKGTRGNWQQYDENEKTTVNDNSPVFLANTRTTKERKKGRLLKTQERYKLLTTQESTLSSDAAVAEDVEGGGHGVGLGGHVGAGFGGVDEVLEGAVEVVVAEVEGGDG